MKIFIYLLLSVVILCSFCTRIEELRYGETRELKIFEADLSDASPRAVRLESGELLVVFRGGAETVSSEGKILLCRSKDGGKTWSQPDTVVSTTLDCRNPSVIQLGDGSIIINFELFRTINRGKRIQQTGCFTVRSFDNGKTFTAPRMIPVSGYESLSISGRILEIEDASLIFPAFGKREGESIASVCVISQDAGETWKEVNVIAKDKDNLIDYKNTSLIQLPDGRLVCMIETSGGDGLMNLTVSGDGGKTWSIPMSSGISGKTPDLLMTSEGTILCSYEDYWPRGVSYVRSYDWGRTWEREVSLLEFEREEIYHSLVSISEDLFALLYSCKTDNAENKGILARFFRVKKPDRPRGFSASLKETNKVNLRWNSVKGAAYYLIYRDVVKDFIPLSGYPFKGNGIATTTTTQYTDVQVVPGSTYYYRVTAVFGKGELLPGTGSEGEPSEVLGVDVQ